MSNSIPFGSSQTKVEAKAFVAQYGPAILAQPCKVPTATRTIDYSPARGAGKRAGSMVKGGMCTLMGPVTYTGLDYSSFAELRAEPHHRRMDSIQLGRYCHGYLLGCNHLEAMMLALCL